MDLSRATDAHLTGLIVNGDADAARALVDRYRRPLAAVLRRALASPADVDDVFQESWIRVVRSVHRYDPEQPFRNWLFTIAWNLVKDRWSRRSEQEEIVDVASGAASAEECLLEEVVRIVESGGTIPEEQREHLQTCTHCRELLESATQFESGIAEEPAPVPSLDEEVLAGEIERMRRRDELRRGGLAVTLAVAIPMAVAAALGLMGDHDWREMAGMIAVVAAFVAGPLVIFFVMRAILRDRDGNRICKRLKSGRLVSGVCLGLSEATGVSPVLLRLGFLVLAFVNGIGLWLYILFDLAMPVHPDDRQHLLRFKLRRMWQRRVAHADYDAR